MAYRILMATPEHIAVVATRLGTTADSISQLLASAKVDPTIPTDKRNIPAHVDFTVLTAFATSADIISLCAKAKQYGTISVCVNPNRVAICKEQLAGTGIRIASVIGFPLGATTAAVKAFESKAAVDAGAQEIDMVIDVGTCSRATTERSSQTSARLSPPARVRTSSASSRPATSTRIGLLTHPS
jgi:deoxyribose-phosphate aldolase